MSLRTFDIADNLDATDWLLLAELQANARISFSELGRRVAMSAPAVAERVRRLEYQGYIRGYHADVDAARLGWPLLAFVRFRENVGAHRSSERAIAERSEILECHHVTGDDCYILKVVARSMPDLEQTTAYLSRYGSVTTSLVYSTPLARRVITDETAIDREPADAGPVAGARSVAGTQPVAISSRSRSRRR